MLRGGKVGTPRRQLQLICENGRVVAAPLAVGRPHSPSKTHTSRPAASTTIVTQKKQDVCVVSSVIDAPTAVGMEESDGTSQTAELLSGTLVSDDGFGETDWIIDIDGDGSADGHHLEPKNAKGLKKLTTIANAMGTLGAEETTHTTRGRIEAVPRRSRLVLDNAGPLADASSASAVLSAVESAAGAATAVSHVVFESTGRAVGALVPAPGTPDQEGQQPVVLAEQGEHQVVLAGQGEHQVVLTEAQVMQAARRSKHLMLTGQNGTHQVVLSAQHGDQQVVLTGQDGDQVVLTLDRDLLRSAGAGDGGDVVLQVDEAADSVTLLVTQPKKEVTREVINDVGEVLELWERDTGGADRLLGSVTESSLVDIRAVCEQCGCVITHHMVGLLVWDDGTEYGFRCRQYESLNQLDRVIDGILDQRIDEESEDAHTKLEADFDLKVEEEEDDFIDSDEDADDLEHANLLDDSADTKQHDRRSLVSRAPKDALWSQADSSDDTRWSSSALRKERKPDEDSEYDRSSRLRVSFTDDGVDEEMEMLAEALKERTDRAKLKRSRATKQERIGWTEPAVKEEPAEGWGWERDGGAGDGRRKDDADAIWAERSGSDASEKQTQVAVGVFKRPRDSVPTDWDDVYQSEKVAVAPSRGTKVRVKGATGAVLTLRTTSRSTAGNRAANVGVSLSRTPHRDGKR
ncbi:hypothetical protein FJT64_020264 [Amphibalanus amphitrite]|uniref:Uncharacterized protein n=1 Tax=Amphibalanus amphitrite TaxID=1232801 RepID=A0A6A4WNZ1_AMPAM|nr:hypothetical protein FJT64_020264 [Amphibalanus amphitrite]